MNATRRISPAIHLSLVTIAFCLWEVFADNGLLDPTFFGRPSGILRFIWKGFVIDGRLWIDLGYTLAETALSFILGSIAAILLGLFFARAPRIHHAATPYLIFLNATPRIALAPLFLLWFGLGMGSKIAVGFSLTFFTVLAATEAGIRSVNPDHLTLSRSLGASAFQIFFKVTLPSATPIIFSGLRLGLIFALIGVVGAELIAAEHGLGQTLVYLQSTFNMDGVMGILVLLSLVGLAVTFFMNHVERRLLAWQ